MIKAGLVTPVFAEILCLPTHLLPHSRPCIGRTNTMTSSRDSGQQASTATAMKMLAAGNLHQCLWLPESATHERVRVSFSTTSNFVIRTLPTVLFVGPMFSTRYCSLMFDKIAKETGVRIICVDRPGMGGSPAAPLEQRINIWLESVKALLARLEVKHVSLVSHSAGTMYSLNTLYRLRDILDPAAPYAAYLGPWVHYDFSKATLWKLVSKLPKGMITTWSDINKFINTRVMPMTSWSGGVISSAVGLFQAQPGSTDHGESSSQKVFGVDEDTAKELDRLMFKYVIAEGISGIDQEALLCLKKSDVDCWGVCENYEKYVQDLVQLERQRRGAESNTAKLKVRFFFAESDIMIGEGGREYMERIWQQDGVADVIDVHTEKILGTNHETVFFDFSVGALRGVLEEIKEINQ